MIIHEHNVFEYINKNYESKGEGGLAYADRLTKGGGEVEEILTMADKGGGGSGNADNG